MARVAPGRGAAGGVVHQDVQRIHVGVRRRVDNDGDIDVVVGNDNGRLRLLVNNIGNRNHWVGVRAVGAQGRDMLGAKVVVMRFLTPIE